MRRSIVLLLALLGLLATSFSVEAKDLSDWAVVLLHGKGGTSAGMRPVAQALEAAGAKVVAPTASWSRTYKNFGAILDEIAGYVAAARAKGGKHIAIVGHSLGTEMALGYGAHRGGIDAIVAMGPGGNPVRLARFTGESLQKAKQMVASGQGNQVGTFVDINQGRHYEIHVTAAAYASIFDPNGPGNMGRNAANLKVPHLLWVVGSGDAGARAEVRGGKRVTVPGGHFQTPKNGAQAVVTWLESL